jgi:hypothetical protein
MKRRWLWCGGAGLLAPVAVVGGYLLYVRHVSYNFGTVVEGQVYRAAQPPVDVLERWKEELGLRTLIRLRSQERDDIIGGIEGLKVVDIDVSARRPLGIPRFRRIVEALEASERPVLFSCASGADRSGVAGVIAAMAVGGADFETARGQLTAWHLHFGAPVADAVVGYEEACRAAGRPAGGWTEFLEWVLTEYRPSYYYVTIAAEAKGGAVAVTIRNDSRTPLPAGEPGRRYRLVARAGGRGVGGVDLPAKTIGPGESADVRFELKVPNWAAPGLELEVTFDLFEFEGKKFSCKFSDFGSPGGRAAVRVP